MAEYKTIALTGHRPNKLWGYNMSLPQYAIVKQALKNALDKACATTVISGMALGFDQIGAKAALETGRTLIAAVPFSGQENNWPKTSQDEYRRLLALADETVIVCNGSYAPWKMLRRDIWMVDHADLVIALWNGSDSGTGHTVRYAREKGIPVWVLNPISINNSQEFVPIE